MSKTSPKALRFAAEQHKALVAQYGREGLKFDLDPDAVLGLLDRIAALEAELAGRASLSAGAEPWGAYVGSRVWVGKLPEHVPKLAKAEGLTIHWLYLAAPAQAPAPGWVSVPAEPTDAMVQAAHHIDLSYIPGQEGADRAAIYRAMIAAAPSSGKGG